MTNPRAHEMWIHWVLPRAKRDGITLFLTTIYACTRSLFFDATPRFVVAESAILAFVLTLFLSIVLRSPGLTESFPDDSGLHFPDSWDIRGTLAEAGLLLSVAAI